MRDFRSDDGGVESSAVLIDIAAVGAGVGDDDLAAEVGEELGGDGGGCSVGAVDDDAAAIEGETGDGGEEELDVLGAIGIVDDGGHGLGREGVGEGELAEDLVLDGEFGGVGELIAVGAEELDAIVLPGIVRRRDDDAGGEFMRAGEEGDGRGGDDAGALDSGARGEEAGGESGGDPVAGLAGVHAEQDAGGLCGGSE